MLALWIPITIAAAFFQNLRSALQKAIKGRLSTTGAAYARFIYALPFAYLYLFALAAWSDWPIPTWNTPFLIYCVLGGLSQILLRWSCFGCFPSAASRWGRRFPSWRWC